MPNDFCILVQNDEYMEIWRDIEGYEGLYKISSEGRVKSLKYGKERILKNIKDSKGYYHIQLHKEGRKTFKVHRLVSKAFIPNHDNLPEVNHKDENPSNNRVDNLEYCDRTYNINYGTRNNKTSKALSIPILQFTKQGEFVRKWDSMIEVERELGFHHGHISKCCKGKVKSAGGYLWGYVDDYERVPFKVFNIEMYRKKVA